MGVFNGIVNPYRGLLPHNYGLLILTFPNAGKFSMPLRFRVQNSIFPRGAFPRRKRQVHILPAHCDRSRYTRMDQLQGVAARRLVKRAVSSLGKLTLTTSDQRSSPMKYFCRKLVERIFLRDALNLGGAHQFSVIVTQKHLPGSVGFVNIDPVVGSPHTSSRKSMLLAYRLCWAARIRSVSFLPTRKRSSGMAT